MIAELKSLADQVIKDIERQAADMLFADRYRLFEEVYNRVGGRMMDLEEEGFDRSEKREAGRKARRG